MNSITYHIADFLKKYAPFNSLSFQELSEIAKSIRVLNLEKNKILFKINDKLHDSFYFVASGKVNLSVIADAEETLLNKCREGDIFGLRPFFAKNNYMMTAKAREESIIYAIPITAFRPFVANNSDVLDFLLHSFASNSVSGSDKDSSNVNLISDSFNLSRQQSELQFFQTISYTESPILVSKNDTAKRVAILMAESLATGAIVVENNLPIGIITATELLFKIIGGQFTTDAVIENMLSSPLVTVVENISLAEAQLMMLKHKVAHLCVTTDGTDQSACIGVISEHDLIAAQAGNPGVLIREIKKSFTINDLKLIRQRLTDLIQKSIHKNIPITHITNVASEINSAIIKRAIELTILDIGSPPTNFAWLSAGSQGRREQLLLTDQDSMLIFEDVTAEKYSQTKDYFLKLASITVTSLEAIGYPLCPDGHQASNFLWCKSLTDWINQYNNWMNSPGENSNVLISVFFDFEHVFGEVKLKESIENNIFNNIKNNTLLFDFLGNDALRKNSPLTFFKKFNVEEKGPNKDKFDIKNRALMALIDSARLFTLSYGLRGNTNTYLRLKQLANFDPKNSEIYLNCAKSFLTLIKYRTIEGFKNDSSGQYMNIKELSKDDKEILKNALLPLTDIEDLIKDKFQLTQFS